MVSAGLDTVPGNLIMGIAHLSSPEGQEIQKKAYNEIMKVYPQGDAWEKCLVEEKVPYITALVREVLRFYTVIPICLPRTSTKDIEYEGAIIPAGTTFYMVSYIASCFVPHADVHRTPGLLTTMHRTSRIQTHFCRNATSTRLKALVRSTMLMGLVLACVLDPTWRIVSCTPHSSD
jgi:hypothetical protein